MARWSRLSRPFFAGGSVLLNERYRVSHFFPVVQEERVHIVSMVSTLLLFLNSYYPADGLGRPKTSTLRHVICAAGPLTIRVMKTFEEELGMRVIHGYGLSETTCYSSFVPLDVDDDDPKKWRSDHGYPSIGLDIPANEMEIHDKEGNSLGENARGGIVVRGVNVMMGYYNDKEANEEAFQHGWFRTGDE